MNSTLAREGAYRLLAACFYTPDTVLLEERPWKALATVLRQLSPVAAQQVGRMEAAAETDCSTLVVEHARLFIGPFALVAAPYGSVYLDPGRTVMGDSAVKVEAFYRQYGLSLDEDMHEPPDHIAIELEFMAQLAFKEEEAGAAGDEVLRKGLVAAQGEFLRTFLLPFARPFGKAIIDDGESPFYIALAQGMLHFLEADATRLASSGR